MNKTFSILLLMAGYLFADTIYAATGFAHIQIKPISDALTRGNVEYLKSESEMTANSPGQRFINRLAFLESRMRLSDAVREAKECYKEEAIRKTSPAITILCYKFAASAALANQDVAQWARIIVDGEDYARPTLKRKVGKPVRVAYFASVSAKNFVKVPPVVISQDKGDSFIPWAKCPHYSKRLATRIQVNGKAACFIVGTGISYIRPKTAKQLGLHYYAGNYGWILRGKSVAGHSRLAVAKSVVIGNVTIHNFPFKVVGDVKSDAIGADALQQLGNVILTAAGLRIVNAHSVDCQQPMTYSFHNTYLQRPVLKVVVNGRPARLGFFSKSLGPVALITNSAAYAGTADVPSSPGTLNLPHAASVTARLMPASFCTPSCPHLVLVAMGYAHYRSPFPIVAGAGLLKRYDLYLGFDSHTACFLPAGQGHHEQ